MRPQEDNKIILDTIDYEKIRALLLLDPKDRTEEQNAELLKFLRACYYSKDRADSPMYSMIANLDELKWFFDHVIQRPLVNESYSAVFVSRHKKLTDEEAKQIGLTRKEGEFLSTVTFRLRAIKDASRKDDPEIWNFDNFVKSLRRFNVDKLAYTTALGEPIPTKTLAVIFYVNPGDDMKVCKAFVDEYMTVNEAISKAMLNGKTTSDNYQSYQWFGKAESTIKHLKANQKGSRYWMDFDIDVPKWFKQDIKYLSVCGTGELRMEEDDLKAHLKYIKERMENPDSKPDTTYLGLLRVELDIAFGKGNYVIVDTSGGYHILVRTSAIKTDPHKFCKKVKSITLFFHKNSNET